MRTTAVEPPSAGPDFKPGRVASELAYMGDFREDVCGGVDFVGQAWDIFPNPAGTSFVLSSSRRESSGMGLVEGRAASGARADGEELAGLCQPGWCSPAVCAEWVEDTMNEAVERILARAEEQSWSAGSARTTAEVVERLLEGEPAVASAGSCWGQS